MSVLFTSDLHLGHEKILETRPFSNIEEHDKYLLSQWNLKVEPRDDIYILGDLSFRSVHGIEFYLNQMKGRKHLIIGNHDSQWIKHVDDLGKYFQSIESLATIKYEKKKLVLCHFPMLEWSGSRYVESGTSYLIHGHIHDSKETGSYEYIKEHLPHALNAGVDINGFCPVTFEELKENNDRWYGRR